MAGNWFNRMTEYLRPEAREAREDARWQVREDREVAKRVEGMMLEQATAIHAHDQADYFDLRAAEQVVQDEAIFQAHRDQREDRQLREMDIANRAEMMTLEQAVRIIEQNGFADYRGSQDIDVLAARQVYDSAYDEPAYLDLDEGDRAWNDYEAGRAPHADYAAAMHGAWRHSDEYGDRYDDRPAAVPTEAEMESVHAEWLDERRAEAAGGGDQIDVRLVDRLIEANSARVAEMTMEQAQQVLQLEPGTDAGVTEWAHAEADRLQGAIFAEMDYENTPTSNEDGWTDEFPDSNNSVRIERALDEHLAAYPELQEDPKWAGAYNGLEERLAEPIGADYDWDDGPDNPANYDHPNGEEYNQHNALANRAAERLADAWNASEPDEAATDVVESEISAEQAEGAGDANDPFAETGHGPLTGEEKADIDVTINLHQHRTHQPNRDDDVAAWIKAQRDDQRDLGNHAAANVFDDLLDTYRLHADTGTPLSAPAHDGPYDENDDELSGPYDWSAIEVPAAWRWTRDTQFGATRGKEQEKDMVAGPLPEDRTNVGGMNSSFNSTDEDRPTPYHGDLDQPWRQQGTTSESGTHILRGGSTQLPAVPPSIEELRATAAQREDKAARDQLAAISPADMDRVWADLNARAGRVGVEMTDWRDDQRANHPAAGHVHEAGDD